MQLIRYQSYILNSTGCIQDILSHEVVGCSECSSVEYHLTVIRLLLSGEVCYDVRLKAYIYLMY